MPTSVFTETKCQGCGKVQRRDGTPDGPPPAWMQGQLTIYGEGNAIRQDVWVSELCVSCGDKVLAALGVKRKRERRVVAPEQPSPPDTYEQDETTAAPPGAVTFHQPAYRYVPDTHEQPQVEYVERPAIIMPKAEVVPTTLTTAISDTGDDPQAPQATNAEQAAGRWRGDQSATPVISHVEASIDGKPWVSLDAERVAGVVRTPEQKAALLSLTGITAFPRSPGWPRGLSRKLTACLNSAIPHRHRVDDPSKPTELTCVDIQYPEKAVAQ